MLCTRFVLRMLVNPDLWTAFDRARETLLAAIKTSLQPESHILSLDASDRNSSKRSRDETIGKLDTFTTRLQEAMNDLDGSCKDIHLCRSRVQTSLSPIAYLPPELIRHVVKLAVGAPENTRTILNLSHVSVAWRKVVTSTSELFTQSNWDRWHVELVTVWLNRAREQPQNIFLYQSVVDALFLYDNLPPKDVSRKVDYIGRLREKLEQALLHCYHLTLEADSEPLWSVSDGWFRSWAMPQLEYLHIFAGGDYGGTISIPENTPALRNIRIHGWFPRFGRSHLITKMDCGPGEEPRWSGWAVMLNNLPSLESLSLELHSCRFDEASPIRLPLLHTLKFEYCVSLEEIEICAIIKSFLVPKIETLILDLNYDEEIKENEMIWDSVVSLLASADKATLIDLTFSRHQPWGAYNLFECCTIQVPSVLATSLLPLYPVVRTDIFPFPTFPSLV